MFDIIAHCLIYWERPVSVCIVTLETQMQISWCRLSNAYEKECKRERAH